MAGAWARVLFARLPGTLNADERTVIQRFSHGTGQASSEPDFHEVNECHSKTRRFIRKGLLGQPREGSVDPRFQPCCGRYFYDRARHPKVSISNRRLRPPWYRRGDVVPLFFFTAWEEWQNVRRVQRNAPPSPPEPWPGFRPLQSEGGGAMRRPPLAVRHSRPGGDNPLRRRCARLQISL